MPGEAKVVIASLAAMVAGLGLGFAFLRPKSVAPAPKSTAAGGGTTPTSSAAGTTPPTVQPPPPSDRPGQNWKPATSVNFLGRVRWTMSLAQAVALTGSAAPTRESVTAALTATWMQGLLQSKLLLVWATQDALPTDWMSDDSFNVELLYGVGYALSLASGTSASDPSRSPPPLGIADLKTHGVEVSGMWTVTGLPSTPTITSPLTWTKATQLNPGDHVRASISSMDWAVINQSLGNVADAACLTFLLLLNAAAPFATMLGTSSILPWCPGDILPPDWPETDPYGLSPPAKDFCFEFRYAGASPLLVSTLPGAVTAWVATGAGA